MRKLVVVMVAGASLLVAAQAPAQVPALMRIVGAALATGTAGETLAADAVNNGSLALLLSQSVVAPDDAQVADLPSGAIVPAVDQCPEGWTQHVDDDGTPLYFPYGLFVDEDRNPRAGKNYYLLRACVRQ